MRNKMIFIIVIGILLLQVTACGKQEEKQEIIFYAAKSLNQVSEELIEVYHRAHPEVVIRGSYDSSGTLMEGILNGHVVDIFFSASQTQMNRLQEEGLVVDGTETNLLNNQVCLITYKGSNTAVTGLHNLAAADSMALADGSVPVGRYTREALVASKILTPSTEVAKISATEISGALDGITINTCANVGAVVTAVAEGSNEVGTVYYSDLYGREKEIEILEILPYELTGNVIYPVAMISNPGQDEQRKAAAMDFLAFLRSKEAREIFERYYFDVVDNDVAE